MEFMGCFRDFGVLLSDVSCKCVFRHSRVYISLVHWGLGLVMVVAIGFAGSLIFVTGLDPPYDPAEKGSLHVHWG